ncbi:hypothetical protein E1B28_008769 [Marasmius oreades]|uniref:GID complex catalytic subunit 2 n=1 Tax=Marasmius oreades TaxID=181124 RepID=A0A9P7RZ77_9AGAR|nr:uncharacterized protein E1B28_008769 [Marasmius oreades]KAG7092412.1 hypothetical protein E1B28_008769 [Marasmius oreades]
MDGPIKELSKLEKLTANTPARGKTASINDSLDSLLEALEPTKQAAQSGEASSQTWKSLVDTLESKKKEIDDRQKEVYSSMSRLGKAIDKKFSTPLPSYSDLFASQASINALERTIALHLLRTGQFDTAQTFIEESGVTIPDDLRSKFIDLHHILQGLRNQDIRPALMWASEHRHFLKSRTSPLEFHLHRSQYIRLLLSTHPPNPLPAIAYANAHLRPFFHEHEAEFKRLMTCIAYLPLSRLQKSVYADLASPTLHFDLEPLFAKEYCASLGMSRQVPLRVVGDIGGGGALVKIEKGRKVMRERKSEWSQRDELPIEIPLPPENRYHSIFTCPVSKEQSTQQNPPMMMSCGHVIAKDSLHKLSKPAGQEPSERRVKCPYCPTESLASSAIQVYF